MNRNAAFLTLGVSCLPFIAAPAFAAGALPTGGNFAFGSGRIMNFPTQVTVNQSTKRAIIDWTGFSIGQNETVTINNGSGATLNRVTGDSLSNIQGSLNASGSVYLINPNGVILTPTGRIITGGSFVASTRDVTDTSFKAGGALEFTGNSSGVVTNQGRITAGGDAALIGKSATNSGNVTAGGIAAVVAGDDVVLTPAGGGVQIQVKTGSGDATNSGNILAAQALIDAAGGNAYALATNNGGVVRATGARNVNGHIWLTASGNAQAAGTLNAITPKGDGGAIDVEGANISVTGTLNANAVAAKGNGGNITVGGPNVPSTTVSGTLLARSGAKGGNGGNIETSGKALNTTGATVDASAPKGTAGKWTLDPADLTITSSAAANIDTALNAGTNVVVQTAPSGAGNGDITVAAPIQKTSAANASLTLKASGSIEVDQPIISTGGPLAVTLDADLGGNGGAVNVEAPIITSGGKIVVGGGSDPSKTAAVGTATNPVGVTINGALVTGSGSITINGAGSASAPGGNGYGVEIGLPGGSPVVVTGGPISITGKGGNTASGAGSAGCFGLPGCNYGVLVNGTLDAAGNLLTGGAVVAAGATPISITGTGGDAGGNSFGNDGVFIGGVVSGGGAAINITGVGGNSRGSDNFGITQEGVVANTGKGAISLSGISGSNGAGAEASPLGFGQIGVANLGYILGSAGDISISGVVGANATGFGNVGVAFGNGVIATGGNGKVTISGSSNGLGMDAGVLLVNFLGTPPAISAADGQIRITGNDTSGNLVGGNAGVAVQSGSIATSGKADVTIAGSVSGPGTAGNPSAALSLAGAIAAGNKLKLQSTGGLIVNTGALSALGDGAAIIVTAPQGFLNLGSTSTPDGKTEVDAGGP